MIHKGLFILLVTLGAVLGSHWLFYFSAVQFFGIDNLFVQTVLLWTFVLLGLGFPLAMMFVWLHFNLLTRGLYFITAFWLGFAINLLMATAVAWGILGLVHLLGASAPMGIVYGLLCGATLTVSAYGFANAMRVKTTRFRIELKNLPVEWGGKMVVHLSDLHLGPIHRVGFLNQVARKVEALEPELVLITGDLFDGVCTDPTPFITPLDGLKAKKGVFFVTGNHEGYLGLERPLEALRKTGIRILDDELVTVDGLQLVGVSYPEYRNKTSCSTLLDREGGYEPKKPAILLHHTPTNIDLTFGDLSTQQVNTYLSPDTDFSFQREHGIDLQLSGHTHAGQIFPFGLLTKRLFNGFDAGLRQVGSFSIITSCGTGTWGPPMRTAGECEIVAITLAGREPSPRN